MAPLFDPVASPPQGSNPPPAETRTFPRDPAQKLHPRVRPLLPQDPGWRLLARHLWMSWTLFGLTLFLTGFSAALEGFGIGLLVPFLDSLLNSNAEPFRTGIQFIDLHLLAVEASQVERLYRVSALLFGVVWMRALMGYLSQRYAIRLRETIIDRIRRKAIDQLQSVSLSFFSKKRSGDLLNTLTSEVNRLKVLFDIARELLVRMSMIIAYGAAVFWLSWELSLITIIFCSGLLLMLSGFLRKLRANGRQIAEGNANVTASASELINGIRTIMEFGTQKHEAKQFATHSHRLRDTVIRASTRGAATTPITMGVSFTGLLAIIIIAVQYFIAPGLMSAAAFLTFMFVLMRLLPLLQSINMQRAQWSIYRGSLENVADLLDPAEKPYLPDGTKELHSFNEGIELRNVSFGYEPGQKVIKDVSFHIPQGQTIAIVGASGSGKSTLANLIARLYDPDEGQILIDGHDLRTLKQSSLRDRMTIVNQTTFLFNTDVWSNIAYGIDPDAISREDVRRAADEANALAFIEDLPQGFDTILGERGARLSGGQRQRIAIARALLRDPDLLILDEATSALDSASESLVQESLERLMTDRTVIVIAHRLSTIENADCVIVLEDGRIAEMGSYQDLLNQQGQLWAYHSLQFEMA